MKSFLQGLLGKKEVYTLHLITCTDTQQLSTSNVVQWMLDTAGVDYQLCEGDSSFEWEFYVSTQEERDYAHKAMDEMGLWDRGRGFKFTFS